MEKLCILFLNYLESFKIITKYKSTYFSFIEIVINEIILHPSNKINNATFYTTCLTLILQTFCLILH